MENLQNIIDQKISDLENKISNAGKFINAITEDCFQGPLIDGGHYVSLPTEQADEIIEQAHMIKRWAIQYELITKLFDDVEDNKKAADSDPNANPDTDND